MSESPGEIITDFTEFWSRPKEARMGCIIDRDRMLTYEYIYCPECDTFRTHCTCFRDQASESATPDG